MKRPASFCPLALAGLLAGALVTPTASAASAVPQTTSAWAAGNSTPAPEPSAFEDRAGAALPLDLPLQDAAGHSVRLGDFFHTGRPVLLVPGYYRCVNLCGTLMQGVLEAAADTGLQRSAYTVLGFSIAPGETPADAMGKEADDLAYAAAYGSRANTTGTLPPPDLHLLLAPGPAGTTLARAIGYGFRPASAEAADGYEHTAGFIVATPQGTVARTFLGVRFAPQELRDALAEASAGRSAAPAAAGLADRLLLLCSHLDPTTGRYSGAVMNGLRALGIACVLALAGWAWRHRRGRPPEGAA